MFVKKKRIKLKNIEAQIGEILRPQSLGQNLLVKTKNVKLVSYIEILFMNRVLCVILSHMLMIKYVINFPNGMEQKHIYLNLENKMYMTQVPWQVHVFQ